jgi:hypothetical protein
MSTFLAKSGTGYGGSVAFTTASAMYLTVSANPVLNFGLGDFTIEGWYYCLNINDGIQDMIVMENGSAYIIIGITPNGAMRVHYNDTPTTGGPFNRILMPTGTAPEKTWAHFCVMRNGTTYSYFQNGVCKGSISGVGAAQMGSSFLPWYIGSDAGGNRFGGNLTNIRIVNGSLVYNYGTVVGTTYFATPTDPLAVVTQTQLLMNTIPGDNYLLDSSINNLTITNTGGVTQSFLTPFYQRNIQFGTSGISDPMINFSKS